MLKVNDNFSLSIQTPDGSLSFPAQVRTRPGGYRLSFPDARRITLSGKEVDDLVSYLLHTGG
jgi:hypothetical protein